MRHLVLALLVALAAPACHDDPDRPQVIFQNPVAPTPTTTAPQNDSAVFETPSTCPAGGPCVASFTVTLAEGQSVAWLFNGAEPPTSEAAAGQVRWDRPDSYTWSSRVCDGDECTPAQGVVTFTEASP